MFGGFAIYFGLWTCFYSHRILFEYTYTPGQNEKKNKIIYYRFDSIYFSLVFLSLLSILEFGLVAFDDTVFTAASNTPNSLNNNNDYDDDDEKKILSLSMQILIYA